MAAYLIHPFGVLLEWTVARPLHRLASRNRTREYIFGHTPHPPMFAEPQPLYDYGVNRKVPMPEKPQTKVTAREPVAEKVVFKEIAVEKPVLQEVTKVVEVERVVFPEIAFNFGSAQLTDLGKGKTYLVAQKLNEKSDLVVVIEGHTDYVGSDDYNTQLGLRRAQTVQNELARLGIDPARMSVISLGETRPLLDEKADWARAVNRRAEFRITSR
jgi:peptidoglycan-associated lipoprotein